MSTKKKAICEHCGRNMTITARGCCGTCYKILYPPHERRKMTSYKRTKNRPNNGEYPKKVMIPCYETSDGKEWGNEIDALRHQLDIERNR